LARALIVGCGCRGRLLGEGLLAAGWAVRGTSRSEQGLEAIEAAGIEPALADLDRVGTVLEHVADVAVVYLLLGSAAGEPEAVAAIHGPRLESLMEKLVDTPVRGVVYEGRGSVDAELLAGGAEIVEAAARTWRIPVEIVREQRDDHRAWSAVMADLALRLLSPGRAPK
jgi:3-hydroxyisobutyrate dehydrogenase-like beta-hydroxyacid dehydrogenase